MKREKIKELLQDSIQDYVDELKECKDVELAITYAAGIKECYYIAQSLQLFSTDPTVLSYADSMVERWKKTEQFRCSLKESVDACEIENLKIKSIRDILLERVRGYKRTAELTENLEELKGYIRAIEFCMSMTRDIGCERISDVRYLYPVVKRYNQIFEKENNEQNVDIEEIKKKIAQDYNSNFDYYLDGKYLYNIAKIQTAKSIPEILYYASMAQAAITFRKDLHYINYKKLVEYKKQMHNVKVEAIERINKRWD